MNRVFKVFRVNRGLRGEQGIQGEQGPDGEQGIQGIQGEQGPKGDKGDTGDKGDPGIQGIQGIQGVQGEQGEKGLQGVPGADGKSAYSSAIEGGYAGTESGFNTALAGIENKASKKVPSAAGNMATLLADGALGDSGKLASDFSASTHVHGNLTNDGKVGSTADLPLFTGTGGVVETKTATNARSAIGAASTVTYTATIPSASWTGSSAPFSKTVSVSGILSTDTPIIDLVLSGTYATDTAMIEDWGKIYRITTAANSITVYATEIPSASINIQLKAVR